MRFTLVELMIVVAIIAVLGAIAIPLLSDYQLRSRAAEVPLMLDGMGKAIVPWALDADFSDTTDPLFVNPACASGGMCYPAESLQPDFSGASTSLGSVVIGHTPGTWHHRGVWSELAFEPTGQVRCAYDFALYINPNLSAFYATYLGVAYAYCDLDRNTEVWISSQNWPRGGQAATATATNSGCEGGESESCESTPDGIVCKPINADGGCY